MIIIFQESHGNYKENIDCFLCIHWEMIRRHLQNYSKGDLDWLLEKSISWHLFAFIVTVSRVRAKYPDGKSPRILVKCGWFPAPNALVLGSHRLLHILLTCYTEECLVPKSGWLEIASSALLGIHTDPKTSKRQPSTVGKYTHQIIWAGKSLLSCLQYYGNRMDFASNNSRSMIIV